MENVATFGWLGMIFKIKILRTNKLIQLHAKEFLAPYTR
jgi:hypothetical protein